MHIMLRPLFDLAILTLNVKILSWPEIVRCKKLIFVLECRGANAVFPLEPTL